MATDYFVIPEDVAKVIKTDQPKTLDIFFLFESDEETFPQFLKLYSGTGVLRCMGDGEIVYFRRYFEKVGDEIIDEVAISNLVLSWGDLADRAEDIAKAWEEQYGTTEVEGNSIRCLGPECPQFSTRGCRPTGRLLFGIDGIARLGFWELVVHQHALIGINSQLDLCRAFTKTYLGRGTILNVPFKLHLRGPEKMKVNGYFAKVYTPEIEPSPEWVQAVMAERVSLPPPQRRPTVDDIWGGEPEKLPPAPVPPEELEELDYEPIEDEWPEKEEEPVTVYVEAEAEQPEAVAEEVGVLSALEFKGWILERVDQRKLSRATDPQQSYIASMLNTVFGNGTAADVARHEFLGYLFGVKSVKDLTKGQAHTLIDWLLADSGKTVDEKYEPNPVVVAQANAVIQQLGKDGGQLDMFE